MALARGALLARAGPPALLTCLSRTQRVERGFQTQQPPYFGSVPIYVRDVLRRKREGTKVFTVDENETVFKATARMIENNIGSLAVTRNGRVCALFRLCLFSQFCRSTGRS